MEVSTRIKYGVGIGGILYASILYQAVITYYFTDILQIGVAATGTLLLVSRIWDGINDPIMGMLIDHTNTKLGRARPYIIVGGLWLALSTAALFINPGINSLGGRRVYAYLTYNSFGMAYTMYSIAISLLVGRIARTRQDVVRVNSSGYIGSSIAAILITWQMMNIITRFGEIRGMESDGYMASGIIAALCILITFPLVFSLRETNCEDTTQLKQTRQNSIRATLKALINNKHYMGFAVSSALVFFGYYLTVGTVMFYCIYNLKNENYISVFTAIDYTTPIIAALLLPALTKRFEKKHIILVALVVITVGYGLRYITSDKYVPVMFILSAFAGIGIGLWNVMFTPIALDCAAYTAHTSGIHAEGLFLSSFTLLTKCASGISGAASAWILDGVGYVPNAIEQSETVVQSLKICATLSIAVFSTAAIIIFAVSYRLKNEQMEKIY